MPPKKRKMSQSTDGSVGDDTSPASTPKIKRRKKPTIQYDPLEFCQELYDTIRNHKTEDGRLLCEPFIRVPKRRTDPEYYDVVTLPIDLLRIQHKLKSEDYEEIEQLTSDIELMVNNAKAFYKPDSQEYRDACDLWDLYSDTKNILIAEAFGDAAEKESPPAKEAANQSEKEDDCSSTMTEDEDNVYEQLFATVVMAKEGDRIISEMFKVLPSRTRYPEYYNVIQNPMDLKTIASKIQNNAYTGLDEMFADLNLMISNAKHFNEPGSQIYKDACTLKKVIQSKKSDLDSGRPRSRRGKRNNNVQGQRLSAICAALTYDEEDESDMNSLQDNESLHHMDFDEDGSAAEGGMKEDHSTPEWQLYNAVKYHKNVGGQLIAEPFMRLPSKRIYPDYYDEIKKPLSLLNVQKKLKNNQYRSIEVMATDLELVFENARIYNMDESKLYLDAGTLQKVLRSKLKELTGKEYDASTPITPVANKARREEEKKTPKRKSLTPEDVLRKRLNLLYKTVLEFQIEGRNLIAIFMVLPSKKDYPDYYQVISEPIDMTMIEAKIKADKYVSDQGLVSDFELMFNNARHYNEEDSQVYRDADSLEKVLKRKMSQLVPLGDSPRTHKFKVKTPKNKAGLSPLEQKLQELYNSIRDYTDSRGRILSTPFIKLPLKSEYPDYYEVIKKPIDMQKVHQRMTAKQYEGLEDMVSDFVLIFDNACKYNEPDSLIYKDALTLQRVCLEKKQELCAEDESNEIPDVRAIVQEMMTNLYIAMYNHTDEDGRCYSDSFQDMPVINAAEIEQDDTGKQQKRTPSFEHVKRNLDRGRYRRMDCFQEDIFEVFEYARKVSRTDSQLYEDAVELQLYFIKKRDEICHNGEVLLTPALSFTDRHLHIALEDEKREKLPKEQKEDEEKRKQQEAEAKQKEECISQKPEADAANAGPNIDSDLIEQNGVTYTIGDFVYLEPRVEYGKGRRSKYREKTRDPHVICIEKMWRDESGEASLHGNFYYRPQETYHVATKKFLEKEVFKSDLYEDMAFSRVMGKCFVMNVKDYFKMKPDTITDKDVYVCESRYSTRNRAFKKIKIWQVPRNEIRLIARDEPLQPVRVASVFAEKKVEELEEDSEEPHILEKEKEIVEIERDADAASDGCTYFEQYKTPAGWFKLGDCVYVRSEDDKPYVAMIDKMWTDQSGSACFHGPWMVHPLDVEHSPTRLFYKREVFRSSIEDTNTMLSIQGKCAVLVYKDYVTSRPTEVPEHDIYICESKYMEAEKAIRKLSKSMKADLEERGLNEDIFMRTDSHFDPSKGKTELRYCCKLCDYSTLRRWNVQRHIIRHNQEDLTKAAAASSSSSSSPRGGAWSQDQSPSYLGLDLADKGQIESRVRLKKPLLSPKVCDDEIYFFKKPITPQKEPSPLLLKAAEETFPEEEEEETTRVETASNANFYREELSLDSIPDITPKEKKKAPKTPKSAKPWQPSGYLVFSAESRKQVQEENPDLTFGDISKVVGQKWREMPKEDKVRYEEKAKKLAEEYAAKQEAADKAFNTSLQMFPPANSPSTDQTRSPAPLARPLTPGNNTQGLNQLPATPSSQGCVSGGYASLQHSGMYGTPAAMITPGMAPHGGVMPNQAVHAPGFHPGSPAHQYPTDDSVNSATPQNQFPLAGHKLIQYVYQPKSFPDVFLHTGCTEHNLQDEPVRARSILRQSLSLDKNDLNEKCSNDSRRPLHPLVKSREEILPITKPGQPVPKRFVGKSVQSRFANNNDITFARDCFTQSQQRSNSDHAYSVNYSMGNRIIGEEQAILARNQEKARSQTQYVINVSKSHENNNLSKKNQILRVLPKGPPFSFHGSSLGGDDTSQIIFLGPDGYTISAFHNTGSDNGNAVPGAKDIQTQQLPKSTDRTEDASQAPPAYSQCSGNQSPACVDVHAATPLSGRGPAQAPAQAAPPARPPSPMFVAVPPRTQRLLHSDAYLRYIEGLGKDDNAVGSWEKSLTATPENTPLEKNAKLPVSWLGQGVGHHDNAVQALWALRDLMMKDTLSIQRTLEFSQLW